MFFLLSKSLGFFAVPSNSILLIGVVGVVLFGTRLKRLAGWLMVSSILLLAVAGWSPLGNALILPLEQRFPPWNPSHGAPAGIVVLGGAIRPGISAARGVVELNGNADRILAAAQLAHRYLNARIMYSGGSASVFYDKIPEAPFAVHELEALGVARNRITAEDQSRNTIENAVFSRLIAQPKPGQHWLLVTSAYHMPRAIATFRAAGFPVEADPVDWRTRGPIDAARPFGWVSAGLQRTDLAGHERVGLFVYWLTGWTKQFFPAP